MTHETFLPVDETRLRYPACCLDQHGSRPSHYTMGTAAFGQRADTRAKIRERLLSAKHGTPSLSSLERIPCTTRDPRSLFNTRRSDQCETNRATPTRDRTATLAKRARRFHRLASAVPGFLVGFDLQTLLAALHTLAKAPHET